MRWFLAAAILALASPVAAQAASTTVSIPGQSFDPGRVTIVAGDTVTWLNKDFSEHDVRAGDGSFDSGHLQRFRAFAHRFDRVAAIPYLCTIHPFMQGQVDVVGALLQGPAARVLSGQQLGLDGRAAGGVTSVALERRLDDGSWQLVGTTAPGSDGAFTFLVAPDASSAYRAVTAAGPSPAITIDVHVTVRSTRRHRLVDVVTHPTAPGMMATLERYSRWHYMWRPLARDRLGIRGRTTFRLPADATGRVRVALSRSRHGPGIATSVPVRLRDGRPAADPLDARPQDSPTTEHGG